MKKLFLICIFVFCTLGITGIANADWSVTAAWTKSPDANLSHEECLLDDSVKCTVQAGDPSTCTFVVSTLNGQQVKIRSYNSQGAYADYVIGNILSMPDPATGGVITITIVP